MDEELALRKIKGIFFVNPCRIYDRQIFDIIIHNKDKCILKQIAKELGYEEELYDYVDRQTARLNFSCVVIYKDIQSLGRSYNFYSLKFWKKDSIRLGEYMYRNNPHRVVFIKKKQKFIIL